MGASVPRVVSSEQEGAKEPERRRPTFTLTLALPEAMTQEQAKARVLEAFGDLLAERRGAAP